MSSTSLQYDDTQFSQINAHTAKDADLEDCHSATIEPDIELDHHQLSDVKEYDPQIRLHLEELNRFATKINQLEKCVEVLGGVHTRLLLFYLVFIFFRNKIPSFKRRSTRAQFN